MTTIVTADLHLAENPRDAYRFKFLEGTLPALIDEHRATRVLVLGDLTELKDGHRAGFVNRVVDGFAALARLADVYVLRGNHDYVAEDVPFYRFLQHLDRVRWIGEPTACRLRELGDCLFLPHTRNLDEEWTAEMLDAHVHDWFFCHQTFAGSDLGHGHLAGGGGPPFAKNSKVISGDVHVPQKVGPVTYVGSPYLIDFGDSFEPRVLVLGGDRMRSVPVPGPQKRLIVLRTRNEEYPDVAPGDVVNIRIEPKAGNVTSRAEWRAQAHKWAESAGVTLYTVQIVAPPAGRTEKNLEPHHTHDDEQLVRTYARKLGRGDKVTVAAGLKLAEETP